MSSLIKKGKKDNLKRVEIPSPVNTFSRNSWFTIDEETKKVDKKKKESTTIRCEKDLADEINAMTVILDFESVNDLLSFFIYSQKSELNSNQLKEFDAINRVYVKKRNLNRKK